MQYRKLKFEKTAYGHLNTMSILFSMFSNITNIEEFAKEYELPEIARPLVETLCKGLGKKINVKYVNECVTTNNIKRTNTVVVAFSGGKDSVSTAMKLRQDGKDVVLFYVSGINKAYPDEIKHAKELAKKLGLPIHIEYVSQNGRTSFKESPIKNQVIASMALNYSVSLGIGCSVAFGDFTTDNTSNSQFYESWSDTQEMWEAWLSFVKNYIQNVELIIPFETYNDTLDIITNNPEIHSLVCGCILPYRFRAMTRKNNEIKYGITLLPNRCGSCWKCCTEYIFMVDKGITPYDKDFYEHCLDFLVKKMPSVHPEISLVNKQTAYEAFLHRPFSCSIINKK